MHDVARARYLLALGLVPLLAATSSCRFAIPRNIISDAFAKDFAPAHALPTVSHPVPEEEAAAVPPPEPPESYSGLLVPIPIVATDPNSGLTGGLMPVLVLQEYERITDILAPWVVYNEFIGLEGVMRVLRYPDRDSEVYAYAAASTGGAHYYELRYTSRRIPPGNLFVDVGGIYSEQLTERFFGLGNDTDEEDETTYIERAEEASIKVGVFFPFGVELSTMQAIRTTDIGRGRLPDLPDIRDLHESVPGVLGRTQAVWNRIDAVLDTRDSPEIPTRGVFLDVYYEIAREILGSQVDYQKFGFDARSFFPLYDTEWVLALRLAGQIVDGDQVPFYIRSSLGGRNTLRGFPRGRFVDSNMVVGSAEIRWTPFGFHLMEVYTQFQVAAFVDAGRVFAPGEEIDLVSLHAVAGGSIRLVVPNSSLVASLDLGVGNEGPAVFVHLGYPY